MAGSTIRTIVLLVAAILFLVPFYLLLRNGLSTEDDITAKTWTFFPHSLQWGNFAELFNDPEVPLASSLVNSVVVSVLQTAGQLLFCSLAGYGLARIPYRHANKVFYAIVATLMIPAAVTFLPTFVVVSSLGWIDDLRGLIIPGLFSGFTAFLFRQYFLDFPKELEEAGRIDGLGYLGTFTRIVVPNSAGFFAAIGVIDFIGAWNSFLWPMIIAQDSSSYTVQVAISAFNLSQHPAIHELFLAGAISIVPLLLVFVLLQRFLVRGIAETGIKG
ncbi:MAG TPA: carbohydrate ABC transporter permease [Pseudonocardiaceae bacterium]|nr:carbohydrate ABC transporter permease [Pseudonocardiaceae bacterium]